MWALIVSGATIVLVLFSFAVVNAARAEKQANVVAAQKAAQQAEADRSQKVRIAALEQQVQAGNVTLTSLSADKATLCANSKAVVSLRATRLASHCQ